MKTTRNSPLLVAALICGIMIPSSAQAQSGGSSDQGSAIRRYGDVQNIGDRNIAGKIWGVLPNQVSLEKEMALGQ